MGYQMFGTNLKQEIKWQGYTSSSKDCYLGIAI